MPFVRSEKRRIRQAQEYLERGQYQQARELLRGMDSSDAIELTAMLNDHEIRRSRGESPRRKQIASSTPLTSGKPTLSPVDRLAIVVIIICMLAWTLVLIVTAYMIGGSGTMLMTMGAALAYWITLWLTYYILWRWFWIVMAIGWVVGSLYGCGTLILLGDLTQSITSMIPRI